MFITCKCILLIIGGCLICSSICSMHKRHTCQMPTIYQICVYPSTYLSYHPSVTHSSAISVSVCHPYPSSVPASNSTHGGNGEAQLWGEHLSCCCPNQEWFRDTSGSSLIHLYGLIRMFLFRSLGFKGDKNTWIGRNYFKFLF